MLKKEQPSTPRKHFKQSNVLGHQLPYSSEVTTALTQQLSNGGKDLSFYTSPKPVILAVSHGETKQQLTLPFIF